MDSSNTSPVSANPPRPGVGSWLVEFLAYFVMSVLVRQIFGQVGRSDESLLDSVLYSVPFALFMMLVNAAVRRWGKERDASR